MSCLMCKGNLEDKLTNFIADLGNCIIIVKDVPSQVCNQCGEFSYRNDVALQLEKIINKTKSTLTKITVVRYSNVA